MMKHVKPPLHGKLASPIQFTCYYPKWTDITQETDINQVKNVEIIILLATLPGMTKNQEKHTQWQPILIKEMLRMSL